MWADFIQTYNPYEENKKNIEKQDNKESKKENSEEE